MPRTAAPEMPSQELVAVKITMIDIHHVDAELLRNATVMDVAVGGCLAKRGGHVPSRLGHKVGWTAFCTCTGMFCP